MDWVGILGDLSPAALLVAALLVISKWVIGPFRELVGNHLEHLVGEQARDRHERERMREAIEAQTKAFERLCDRLGRS